MAARFATIQMSSLAAAGNGNRLDARHAIALAEEIKAGGLPESPETAAAAGARMRERHRDMARQASDMRAEARRIDAEAKALEDEAGITLPRLGR